MILTVSVMVLRSRFAPEFLTSPRALVKTMRMLRAGRFRHRLLETSFLKQHSKDIFGALEPFLKIWQAGRCTDYEIAAIYILVFSFFRRPLDFLGGPHKEFESPRASPGMTGLEVIETLRYHLPTTLQDKKILRRLATDESFLSLFCSFSWRSIPVAVPRALCAWQRGLYPLSLLTTVPSPEEVLKLQGQGRRCVSMLITLEQIENFVEEGRDVLGFIVHDLIHADHFFSEPERAQAQILFSQKLQKLIELPQIQKLLKIDPVFQAEFHYLMSDMNSVPLHLLKTLKAILLGHFKRSRNAHFTAALCPETELEFLRIYQDFLKFWNFDEASWSAALRLNTPLFRGHEDAVLLDVALKKIL